MLLEAQRRADAGAAAPGHTAASVDMAIDALRPGRYQPRQQHSEETLAELAASIREQGVLQPLVVRRIVGAAADAGAADAVEGAAPGGQVYEIVAGERRWRAARLAGLTRVPVLVRELDDQSALAVALIENLQREDLNPIDQARSLSRLADEFSLTHDQVAKAVGRSRSAVSNLLRLLDLNDDVKELLARGRIDMGHARALLPLDAPRQSAMARRTESRGMSVRQVEKAVRKLLAEPAAPAPPSGLELQTRWLQQQLGQELGQRVTIRPGKDGHYTLQIGFAELQGLQDTLERLQQLVGRLRDAAGPRSRDTT